MYYDRRLVQCKLCHESCKSCLGPLENECMNSILEFKNKNSRKLSKNPKKFNKIN